MLLNRKTFLFITLLSLLVSCKSEYKFILNAPKKLQTNQQLTISVSEKSGKPFEKVQFTIDNKKIESKGNSATITISDYKLGKHIIEAVVFYEGKTKKVIKPVYFLAEKAPELYTYEIVNTYPHDRSAYTQGLQFYKGFLYEGTGRPGESWLRKVELETGKVLQQIDLDEQYFGEGITILNDKIYQLTWKKGIGFVYDLETFEKLLQVITKTDKTY